MVSCSLALAKNYEDYPWHRFGYVVCECSEGCHNWPPPSWPNNDKFPHLTLVIWEAEKPPKFDDNNYRWNCSSYNQELVIEGWDPNPNEKDVLDLEMIIILVISWC